MVDPTGIEPVASCLQGTIRPRHQLRHRANDCDLTSAMVSSSLKLWSESWRPTAEDR